MSRRRGPCHAGLAAVLLLAGATAAFAQADHDFMPKGGNVLLQAMFAQAPADELHAVLGGRHSAAEWQALLQPRSGGLDPQERRTVAAYLATNMPLAADAAAHAAVGDLARILPPDGDTLAWNRCGSCHSLFSSYLMQDRDMQGWLSVFLSPFHRGIRMTLQERATFAGYAAINMPLPREKVPPDLQF
jgi:hypothetical protein